MKRRERERKREREREAERQAKIDAVSVLQCHDVIYRSSMNTVAVLVTNYI